MARTKLPKGPDPRTVFGRPARRTPTFKPFQPFQPDLSPPPGYFDPALDINLAATKRGLFDTTQDAQTSIGRMTTDYEIGKGDINQGADRSLEDLATSAGGFETSHDRTLADIGTRRQQAGEDYNRNVGDLELAYKRRQQQQLQGQNAAGVLRGGAQLQAAAKRSANMAHDRQPLDTGYQRLVAGLNTDEARANEDFGTGEQGLSRSATRIGQDRAENLGKLALESAPADAGNPLGGRSYQDIVTGLTRAGRETTQLGIDTASTKAAQASAAGWDPMSGRPANEYGSGAAARRVIVRGGTSYVIDAAGHVVSKRPVKRR